jgi:hypothetical protein
MSGRSLLALSSRVNNEPGSKKAIAPLTADALQ